MSVLLDLKTGDPEAAGARYQLAGYDIAYRCGSGELIDFEAAGHIYRHKATGAIKPSVTQILRATGISLDFEELSGYGKKVGHAVQLKRDLGSALHHDAHAFDDDDLDWSTVNEAVKPFLDAYVTFRQAYPHLTPATRERIVYCEEYQFVGTLDGIFLADGEAEIDITERWSVQLCPERKVPYRVTPYNDSPWIDNEKFKAFAVTFHEQYARRRAA